MILLIAILILIFPPLSALGFVLLWKNPTQWKYAVFMYACFMGWLAFTYVPLLASQTDLTRYLLDLNIYKNYPLSEVFNIFYYKEIGEIIWIKAIGIVGIPGLLAGIPTAVIYGITGYITCDYAQRKNKLQEIRWVLPVQFLLLPFASIVNNIFNVTAFSLIILAAYRDLIQGKRNLFTLGLYIVPCIIHQSAPILILARLIAIVYKRFKYLSIAMIFGLPTLVNISYHYNSLFINFKPIYKVIIYANLYLNEFVDSDFAIAVRTALLPRLNFWINLIFSFLTVFSISLIWKQRGRKFPLLNTRENVFLSFIFIIAVLALSCVCFSAPHYWRFNFAIQTAIGIILVYLNSSNAMNQLLRISFALLGMSQFVIQTYLLLFRYTLPDQWLVNFLLVPPVRWAIEML